MQGQYTLGGRQATRTRPSLTKPEQSRLILVGTTGVVVTVLLAWLLLLRFLNAPGTNRLPTLAIGPPESARALPLLAEDCRVLGVEGTARTAGKSSLDDLRDALNRPGNEPIVAYVAAVGISTPEGAFFLPADGAPSSKDRMIPLEKLLDLFLVKDRAAVPKLLILDAVQVASDRNLGVYGNGFVDRLKENLQKAKYAKLAVLCSCDSGQMSWTSEVEGRSVFGYYVAEGLASARGGKVGDLYNYVRPRVYSWVKRNRDAVQTPVLLGGDSSSLTLPLLSPRDRVDRSSTSRTIPRELETRWEERGRLEYLRPYRHVPRLWRRYQDTLLRAEGLIRVGREDDARTELSKLDAMAIEIKSRAGGLPIPQSRSLAMFARGLDDPATSKSTPARAKDYLQAIEDVRAGASSRGEPVPPAGDPAKVAARVAPTPARTPLGEDDLGESPIYVEGQLSLWFSEFARRGGASDLDPTARRLEVLRQGNNLRRKAEEVAASDDRIVRFIRGQVELVDDRRRRAQDDLFAADPASLEQVAARLSACVGPYDQAADNATRLVDAVDLVQRVEAELPYYGEWIARWEPGSVSKVETLLDKASELADLLDREPVKGNDTADPIPNLQGLVTVVEQSLKEIIELFQGRCRIASGSDLVTWREVDALLCVPMASPAEHKALLSKILKIGSGGLSPPLADVGRGDTPPTDAEPDSVARDRALGLARLEWGLLKLGGLKVRSLPESLETARDSWKDDVNRAAIAYDGFSESVRQKWNDGFNKTLQPAPAAALQAADEGLRQSRSVAEAADEELRQTRSAADRLTRVMPPPELARLSVDPTDAMDRFHRYALLLWHGQRLLHDGATRQARHLLEDARDALGRKTPAFDLANVDANTLAETRLTVTPAPPSLAGRQRTISVSIESKGDLLPEGNAALFFHHDPAIPLKIDEPDRKPGDHGVALISVPTKGEVKQRFSVAQVGPGSKLDPIALNPEVFYRGRYFEPTTPPPPERIGDLVDIKILQQKRYTAPADGKRRKKPFTFDDQFEKQQVRGSRTIKGALHPFHNLDYKLVVRNLTQDKRRVCVAHGMDGEEPTTETVELGPEKSTDSITGRVWANDVPDNKLRTLTITVTEEEKDGRPACKPLKVVFKKIPPREFITAMEGVGGGEFIVFVTHEDSDPVPIPAEVQVKMEPVEAFREIGNSLKRIDPGDTLPFRFRILKPVSKVQWTVQAEGVSDVVHGGLKMADAPAAKDIEDSKKADAPPPLNGSQP